ncbi:hypothetical protein GCM10028798_26920 [Humibacter antri]
MPRQQRRLSSLRTVGLAFVVAALSVGSMTGCSANRDTPVASVTPRTTSTASASATPAPIPSPSPTANLPVTALAVGDCLTNQAGSDQAEDIQFLVVSCALPHSSEVIGLPSLGSGAYPGDDAVAGQADDVCDSVFAAYVGVSIYDTTAIDVSAYTPDQADWSSGRTQAVCVAFSPAGDTLGSVKGIGAAAPSAAP